MIIKLEFKLKVFINQFVKSVLDATGRESRRWSVLPVDSVSDHLLQKTY